MICILFVFAVICVLCFKKIIPAISWYYLCVYTTKRFHVRSSFYRVCARTEFISVNYVDYRHGVFLCEKNKKKSIDK